MNDHYTLCSDASLVDFVGCRQNLYRRSSNQHSKQETQDGVAEKLRKRALCFY